MDAGTGRPAEPQRECRRAADRAAAPGGGGDAARAFQRCPRLVQGRTGRSCGRRPALERVFGWRPSDVIGTPFRLAPDRGPGAVYGRPVVDAMTRGDDGVTVRLRAQAGGRVPRAGPTRPTVFIRDVDGIAAGSVASIRDVTAEVEAEERYRLLAENATDMVFLRDAAGTDHLGLAVDAHRPGLRAGGARSGRTRWTTCIPTTDPWRSAVRAQVGSGEAARGVVARIRRADGTLPLHVPGVPARAGRVRRRGRRRRQA